MKFLLATIIALTCSVANADWVVVDPPTYAQYDPVSASTLYVKGCSSWRTYNVLEHTRRGVLGTMDFLHYGITSGLRRPIRRYYPIYYYRPVPCVPRQTGN